MAAMTDNQNVVKRLRQRLPGWHPNGKCSEYHGASHQCCVYNKQGELIELHLCKLGLAQIPPEIWQCSSLQWLCLNGNQFRTLPVEIGQLSALQWLDLKNNQFNSLPTEIGQLLFLKFLDLSNNRLNSLPAEIGQLSSLNVFYLGHNRLNSLPVEMGQLFSLLAIELDGNSLQSPPPAIIGQGVPAIINYLRNLQADAVEEAAKVAAALVAPSTLSTTSLARPITIFYCYAHEDRNLRNHIDSHLGVLKRTGQVTGWYDREIQAGTEWEQEIETHLSTASIILLLVSADFVNSDYCYGVEMQKALKMHEKGETRVLPILLRPVDWQDAPFAKLQILPTGAKPITSWSDPEEALEDVAKQIRAVVSALRTHRS